MTLAFPLTATEMTAEWLTSVLRDDGALDERGWVEALELQPLSVGFGQTSDTTRVRLTLGGRPPEPAPMSLVAKFSTTEAARRSASVSAHLYANEVLFYQSLSDRVTTSVPRCFFAAIDDAEEFSALLLEDFADHRPGDETVGATANEARQALAELAALHGPYWGHASDSGCRPWRMLPLERVEAAWPVMVDTFGDCLPRAVLATEDRYLQSIPALHNWMLQEPTTLAHGDFRLDNLLFDGRAGGEERIVVLDWQAVHTGRGIRDFAYLVAHSVQDDERRDHERDLLHFYLDRLGAFGVDYPFEVAWEDYRVAMLYLFSIVLWITGVNVNTNERALRRKRALVRRASSALLDADALDLLPFSDPTSAHR